jgi:hypothetical protein
MEKDKFFYKKISEVERKTILSLIEVDDHGIIDLVKKRLREICKETKIERSKQYKILERLVRNKSIIKKDDIEYQVKPQYKELAYSSIIKDQISNLENNGIFRFSHFTFYGFKDKNKWFRYPEIQHFHEALVQSEYLLFRLKQIKAIFLVRDFIPIWKKILKTEIHPAIKYELWSFSVNNFWHLHETKNDFIDNQLRLLYHFKVYKKEEIEKFRKKIKEEHNNFTRKLKSRHKKENKYYKLYDEKINLKLIEYNKLYTETIFDYIESNLLKKDRKIVSKLINYIINYHKEINNIGIWTDLGKLGKSSIGHVHWKKPYDNLEKNFRAIHDSINLNQIQEIGKNIKKEEIDNGLQDFKNIYDDRNYHRFSDRLLYILANDIEKPKYVLISNPRLKKIRKQIVDLAIKSDSPKYKIISNFIEKGILRSDIEIFSFIVEHKDITYTLRLTKHLIKKMK